MAKRKYDIFNYKIKIKQVSFRSHIGGEDSNGLHIRKTISSEDYVGSRFMKILN